MIRLPLSLALALATTLPMAAAIAAPVVYEIDPSHTYPSFEADHLGGVSTWRGKFNHSTGTVTLDKAAGSGTVDLTIDTTSVDFGHDDMNTHARGADMLDTAQHPTARYVGTLAGFSDGGPTRVDGELTLRGVTHPVVLEIRSFKCIPHPLNKRDLCGADALVTIDRSEFGIVAGKDYGFDMAVTLRIQVEAVASP